MVGLLRRFRKKDKPTVEQAIEEIGIGASLPQVDVEVLNTDEDGKVFTEIKTVGELLAGTNKAIVLGKQPCLPDIIMLVDDSFFDNYWYHSLL